MSSLAPPTNTSTINRSVDMYELRLFVQFIQGVFNYFPKDSYHFSHDREDTRIAITLANSVDMSVVSMHPIITVGRSGFSERPVGMGGFLGHGDTNSSTLYTRLIRGQFVVKCIAGTEVEASGIASIIKTAVISMYDLLESEYGFQDLGGSGLNTSQASPPASADNSTVTATEVTVMIPYTIQKTIEVIRNYNPSNMSLNQITDNRHATDFEQLPLRVFTGFDINLDVRTTAIKEPNTSINVNNTIDNYQVVIANDKPIGD